MPGVPAAVYLVLHVTTVKKAYFQEWLCVCSECACACAYSQEEETPTVPGVGLLQRIIPPSVLRWDVRASKANLPTSCSNLAIPGVSEVEHFSPRGVKIQHASHPPSLCHRVRRHPVPTPHWWANPFFPALLTFNLAHCCPRIQKASQPAANEPCAATDWETHQPHVAS